MGVTIVVTRVTSVNGSPSAVLLRSSAISCDDVFLYWLLLPCKAVTSVTMQVSAFFKGVTEGKVPVTSVTMRVSAFFNSVTEGKVPVMSVIARFPVNSCSPPSAHKVFRQIQFST